MNPRGDDESKERREGMKIFIASFGSKVWIQKKMKGYPIVDIYTSGGFDGFMDGDPMKSKNPMIERARKEYGVQKPLLVDDSKDNLDLLEDGVEGYWIRGNVGITKKDATEILSRISERGYDSLFLDADKTLFRDHVTSRYYYDWMDADKDEEAFDVETNILLAEGGEDLFQGLKILMEKEE